MIVYKLLRAISNLPIIRSLKLLYGKMKMKRRNKCFLRQGCDTLLYVDSVLTKNGIHYSVVFGTLLGAIREKGFIKHDLDIDLAIWYDEVGDKLHSILTTNGFSFKRRIEVDEGKWGREETYIYNGVTIDFFYFYKDDNNKMPYTPVFVTFPGYDNNIIAIEEKGGMMPIQLFLPLDRETKYVQFENITVPAICNAEEFLEARYGKSWRIPDPTFVYPKMGDVSCAYREDKLGKIIHHA